MQVAGAFGSLADSLGEGPPPGRKENRMRSAAAAVAASDTQGGTSRGRGAMGPLPSRSFAQEMTVSFVMSQVSFVMSQGWLHPSRVRLEGWVHPSRLHAHLPNLGFLEWSAYFNARVPMPGEAATTAVAAERTADVGAE